ncbi:hypothetical protein ACXY7D_11935 [Sphingomonas melonis]
MKLVALTAIAFASSASAQSSTVFAPTRSGQTIVCADYNSGSELLKLAVDNWVVGYFSGINVGVKAQGGTNFQTGENTTASGLVGEFKLICATNPSNPISLAAAKLYAKMSPAK